MTFKKQTVIVLPTKQGEWKLEVRADHVFVGCIHIDLEDLDATVSTFCAAMEEVKRLLEAAKEEAK